MRQHPTPAEALLWEKLRGRQTGFTFHTQVILQGYIVDFYCGAVRLAIEVDGSSHDEKEIDDGWRDVHLIRKGRNVLRFRNREVFADLQSVVGKIIAECEFRDEARRRGALKGFGFDSPFPAQAAHKERSSNSSGCASLEISGNSRPALTCTSTVNVGNSAENLCTPEDVIRVHRKLSLLSFQKSFPFEPPIPERINSARVRLAEYIRKQKGTA